LLHLLGAAYGTVRNCAIRPLSNNYGRWGSAGPAQCHNFSPPHPSDCPLAWPSRGLLRPFPTESALWRPRNGLAGRSIKPAYGL